MFYILHGADEFTCLEALNKLKGRMAQEGMGDLNISRLDGRTVGLQELMNACNTLPFLFDRRMVIVEDLLQRFQPRRRSRQRTGQPIPVTDADKEFADKLADYLPDLPPTTRLVFVEGVHLGGNNRFLKRAKDVPDAYIHEYKPREGRELENWLRERTQAKGASISPQAAALLLSLAGQDLRRLDQELEKLSAYVDYVRPIAPDDVRALVSGTLESNIFALVDALGLRQRRRAMSQLEKLLADPNAHELYVLAMIARQIRLILAAKDLSEAQGMRLREIRRKRHISREFIVEKLLAQSARFGFNELEAIVRRIAEIDQAVKTGRTKAVLALELLVLEICQTKGKRPAGRA